MESLYTKYRPQTFADVVGQGHVVTTLQRAVLEGRTSHAYLFCGPRGTGKTTMARLLAKALMCEQGEGHLPDGTCEQCRMIAAGEHPDVYELDAASRTGVDNVRDEIISRVSFAPVRAPYKMYIIDEVHMLTVAAFNALLKTLEEPPSHVVFVLCTTDPQKIPETILSRVQRFDFHAISKSDIQGRLTYICDKEGFEYDPEAIELVVRHARGGMRDAISELEQLSVSGGGSITVDVARDVLGEVSASMLERMSLAMAKRDVPSLFAQVESLVEAGRDLLQFTRALAARIRDVYVVCVVGEQTDAIAASDDELPAISREAKAFGSVDRVSRALELLSEASTEMRVAPNQRLVLEVALTKIARPQTELTIEALADRVASLERQVAALSAPGARQAQPAVQSRPAAASAEAPAPARPVGQSKAPARPTAEAPAQRKPAAQRQAVEQPARAVSDARPRETAAPQPAPQAPAAQPAQVAQRQQAAAAQPAQTTTHQQRVETPAQQPTQAQPQVTQPAAASPHGGARRAGAISDPGELQRLWKQVVDNLLSSHPQHGSLLMSSTIAFDDGETITISLPKGSSFASRMLERADVRACVDPVVNAVFGHRKAVFVQGSPAQAPSASSRRRVQPEAARQAPAQQPPMQQPRTQQAPVQQAPAQQPPMQQPRTQQALVQQPPAQPTIQQAPVQPPVQQAPVQQPPVQVAARPVPAQPQQTYAAPWEPLPDDAVPYGEFDAMPFEEDQFYDVGPSIAGLPIDPAPQRREQVAAPQAPSPAREPSPVAFAPQPDPTPASVTEPAPQAPKPTPDPAPKPPAPARDPELVPQEAAPKPEPKSEPEPPLPPAQEQTPASEPTAEQAAAQKPARRPRRATGGIPADIVSMMAEIFGEGVTYTTVEADDESEEADLPMDDAEAESEYIDEPVDDADDTDDDQ